MKNFKSISLVIICYMTYLSGIAQAPTQAVDISPLLVGEKLPEATVIDKEGQAINLNSKIAEKNTVLVFYRGGWCPYCNRHLAALGEIEEEILQLGYQIIAVSPDDYQNLKPTIEKDKTNYNLYADPQAKFIQDIGIGFKASDRTVSYIAKKTVGEATDVLPVPTLLVLNTDGEILFEYISPNYRQRISSELLISVLKNL